MQTMKYLQKLLDSENKVPAGPEANANPYGDPLQIQLFCSPNVPIVQI